MFRLPFLATLLAPLRGDLGARDRFEAAAMLAGLGCLASGLALGAAQAVMAPAAPSLDELQGAIAASGVDRALCPDGWAAEHAAFLDMSEAEVSAWYLAESLRASDAEILRDASAYFSEPSAFEWVEGMSVTAMQVTLCVAQSRRMI